MNAKYFADKLNGCEYYDDMRKKINALEQEAKTNGFVIVYGCSDDLVELAGAISDEVDAYEGVTFYLTQNGVKLFDRDCEQKRCPYIESDKKYLAAIEALWGVPDSEYSWQYNTEIPHETFDVMEDGEKYCQGIVFKLSDLPKGKD